LIGQAIGPYEIVREIGRGGMGVVYLARDTKLDRDVAIKMLPDEVAEDPSRLARFEREAKLLASLRHANIAAVYGLEEVEGKRCLVLEYVDGLDLAERLMQAPVPLDEALVFAREITEAIEAAHAQGIIHRDLKPANIKINEAGEVKVLDFGLAKALHEQPSSMVSDPSASPTVVTQHSPTMPGVILGTAGYMSPEQARGRAADKRSDIWSFGCILFEMLSGARVFGGETVTDSLGAILHKDPTWSMLPPETPPAVQLLLRRCLKKDRKRRLQDIGDARIELEELIADPTASSLSLAAAVMEPARPRRRRAAAAAVLVGLAGLAAGGAASWLLHPKPSVPPLRKFTVPVTELTPSGGITVSPDGRRVAYVAEGQLWVRTMDSLDPRTVPETSDVLVPFWSPDSQHVAFASHGRLWKASADGGRPVPIASVGDTMTFAGGAAWCADGRIVFTSGNSGLRVVSAQGGDPKSLLKADDDTEDDYHDVTPLPDGRGVLFVIHRLLSGADTLAVFDGEQKKVIYQLEGERLYEPWYSPTGHIVYHRQTGSPGIWALPFSLSELEATGDPFLVVADSSWPSVAADGTLVYVQGAGVAETQLALVDRRGEVQSVIGQPQRGLFGPKLSPDGTKVAVTASQDENREIWVHDVNRGTVTRLSFTEGDDWFPNWTPDGRRISFLTLRSGGVIGMIRSADGTGAHEELGEGWGPGSYSRDGRYLLVGRRGTGRGDVGYIDHQGDGEPVWLLTTDANEGAPALSPNGDYLAYTSDESGRDEIYLTRFPGAEGRWQVSLDGGRVPRWNAAGDELYFNNDGKLHAVSVQLEPSVVLGTPEVLFAGQRIGVSFFFGWDVTADGQQFLVVQNKDAAMPARAIVVVQSWLEEFRTGR
jgi:serine/threonine protein kinase